MPERTAARPTMMKPPVERSAPSPDMAITEPMAATAPGMEVAVKALSWPLYLSTNRPAMAPRAAAVAVFAAKL